MEVNIEARTYWTILEAFPIRQNATKPKFIWVQADVLPSLGRLTLHSFSFQRKEISLNGELRNSDAKWEDEKNIKSILRIITGQSQMVEVVLVRECDIGEQWEETLSQEGSSQERLEETNANLSATENL